MQKKAVPKIHSIITPSQSSKRGIINDFKCEENNITVINNGLDSLSLNLSRALKEIHLD